MPPFRSTVPTAFAGYSFHAAEAALVFANEIIVIFLFPIHAGLHRAYHLFTTLIHLGTTASHSSLQGLMHTHIPAVGS
jgi:Delta7-sterol 5-desaturase